MLGIVESSVFKVGKWIPKINATAVAVSTEDQSIILGKVTSKSLKLNVFEKHHSGVEGIHVINRLHYRLHIDVNCAY